MIGFSISDMPPNGRRLDLEAISGWPIPNLRPLADLLPIQKEEARRTFRQSCPDAKLLSESGMYDCMGLTFASRRTSIDIGFLGNVLREDGYVRVPNREDLVEGDLVVYTRDGRPWHVGVITYKIKGYVISTEKIMVLSKWGYHGEYVHELNDVPKLFGNTTEFWRLQ